MEFINYDDEFSIGDAQAGDVRIIDINKMVKLI